MFRVGFCAMNSSSIFKILIDRTLLPYGSGVINTGIQCEFNVNGSLEFYIAFMLSEHVGFQTVCWIVY